MDLKFSEWVNTCLCLKQHKHYVDWECDLLSCLRCNFLYTFSTNYHSKRPHLQACAAGENVFLSSNKLEKKQGSTSHWTSVVWKHWKFNLQID